MLVLFSLVAGAAADFPPRADTLAQWFGALKLFIPDAYEDKFSGIEVEVKDLECDNIEVGKIEAKYEAPRTLVIKLEDLRATCEGDYQYKYDPGRFLPTLRGDGKLDAKIGDSTIELDVLFNADAKGASFVIIRAPTTLELDACKTKLNVRDVDIKGDFVGSLANLFVDSFVDFFVDEVEKIVCDSLAPFVKADLAALVGDFGLDTCIVAAVGATSVANPEVVVQKVDSSEWVAWDAVFANATGPLADVAGSIVGGLKPREALAMAMDALESFDVPLASAKALKFGGPLSVLRTGVKDDAAAVAKYADYRDMPLLADLRLDLAELRVRASEVLGQLEAEDWVEVTAEAPGGARVKGSIAPPRDVVFDVDARLGVAFALGHLGDDFEQGLLSPRLRFDARIGVNVSRVRVAAAVTIGAVAARTRRRLNSILLGDVLDLDCLAATLALDDVALDSVALDYSRSRINVSKASLVNAGLGTAASLEADVTESVIPALVELVDAGFGAFVDCAVVELVNSSAAEALTDFAREVVGALATAPDAARRKANRCAQRRPWRTEWLDATEQNRQLLVAHHHHHQQQQQREKRRRLTSSDGGHLVDWNASSLAEAAVDAAADFDAASIVRSALKGLYDDDETEEIEVYKHGRVRVPALRTTIIVEDVRLGSVAKAVDEVLLFPLGDETFTRRTAAVLAGRVGYAAPVTMRATVRFKTPVGGATVRFNVSVARVRVESVHVAAWLDGAVVNALSGGDVGLPTVLDAAKGSFEGFWCLASALESATVPRAPKFHIGSLGLKASSDVPNLAGVVELVAKTLVAYFGEYVDRDAAVDEALYQLNKLADDVLDDARDSCIEYNVLRTNNVSLPTPVARRVDRAGESPRRVAIDEGASGINGTFEATLQFIVVVGLLGTAFFSCWLISNQGATIRAVRRMRRLDYWGATTRRTRKETPAAAAKDDDPLSTRDQLDGDEARMMMMMSTVPSVAETWLEGNSDSDSDSDDGAAVGEAGGAGKKNKLMKHSSHRSLFSEARAPTWFKCLLVAIMLGNTGLLICSNILIGAEVQIRLLLDLDDAGSKEIWVPTDAKFSLAESVSKLWNAGSYLLAILIVLLSGFWPYLELSLLMWGFLTPGLGPTRREAVWRVIETLSKWSFIDVFIIVFIIVAFHIRLRVASEDAAAQIDVFVAPRVGFYAFCGATMVSMCMGQLLLYLHRATHHHGRTTLDKTDPRAPSKKKIIKDGTNIAPLSSSPSLLSSSSSSSKGKAALIPADGVGCPASADKKWQRPEEDASSSSSKGAEDEEEERRRPGCTFAYRRSLRAHCRDMAAGDAAATSSWATRWRRALPQATGLVAMGVGALMAVAYAAKAVEFEIGGAAGFAIDVSGDDSDQRYNAGELALALLPSSPSDGWRPLVKALAYATIIFALLMPVANVFLLVILWLAPLTAPTQVRLLALSEVAFGWSSLDVYLVSIIATATQITEIASGFAKDQCEDVDGFLRAFFDAALGGDTTCLRIAVKIRPGCILLTCACFAHLLLGYLTASLTTTAVAQRAADYGGAFQRTRKRLSQPAPPPTVDLEMVRLDDASLDDASYDDGNTPDDAKSQED